MCIRSLSIQFALYAAFLTQYGETFAEKQRYGFVEIRFDNFLKSCQILPLGHYPAQAQLSCRGRSPKHLRQLLGKGPQGRICPTKFSIQHSAFIMQHPYLCPR